MHFSFVNLAGGEAHHSDTFALPPPTDSIELSQPGDIAYFFANGDCLDMCYLADDGEAH